jgi:large subunit ribosomal protein L23
MKKNSLQIIIEPLVTEKASNSRALNKYFFVVDKKARKGQIKQAVEKTFNVRVQKVNTALVSGKTIKRWGKTIGSKSDWKKAVVTLFAGEKIDLLEGLF